VRFDRGALAAYPNDASICRQVPIGVIIPRHADDVAAAMAVCRRHEVPVLGRGRLLRPGRQLRVRARRALRRLDGGGRAGHPAGRS
jgi:FAD/FMN-containing dehydrogenase